MVTSSIQVTPGSGEFVPTYDIVEDEVTKRLQRAVLNDSDGLEIGTETDPIFISLSTLLGGEDLANNVLATTNRPVSTSVYSPSVSISKGTVTAVSAKATPGNFLGAIISNSNAAVRYFQIHNKIIAPASSDSAYLSFPIPAGTTNNPGVLLLGRDLLGPNGIFLSTGVAFGFSTANSTFTAATAGDHNAVFTFI